MKLKALLPFFLVLACAAVPEIEETTPAPVCRVEVVTRFEAVCLEESRVCVVDTYADVETPDEFPGRHDLWGCTDAQGVCQTTCQPTTPCAWPGPPAVWRDGAWRLPDGTVKECP